MFNAISKLIVLGLIAWFMLWASYKIGVGLGHWSPFVMVIIGLVCGAIVGIVKLVADKNSKK